MSAVNEMEVVAYSHGFIVLSSCDLFSLCEEALHNLRVLAKYNRQSNLCNVMYLYLVNMAIWNYVRE